MLKWACDPVVDKNSACFSSGRSGQVTQDSHQFYLCNPWSNICTYDSRRGLESFLIRDALATGLPEHTILVDWTQLRRCILLLALLFVCFLFLLATLPLMEAI